MALIECCLHNLRDSGGEVLRESDHRVRRSRCLDRCGQCHESPFLVVDGEVRVGGSHRDLLDATTSDVEGDER